MARKDLSDNATHDALHDAAERLRPMIDRAESRAARSALEAAVKALDLLAMGVIRAQADHEKLDE